MWWLKMIKMIQGGSMLHKMIKDHWAIEDDQIYKDAFVKS